MKACIAVVLCVALLQGATAQSTFDTVMNTVNQAHQMYRSGSWLTTLRGYIQQAIVYLQQWAAKLEQALSTPQIPIPQLSLPQLSLPQLSLPQMDVSIPAPVKSISAHVPQFSRQWSRSGRF